MATRMATCTAAVRIALGFTVYIRKISYSHCFRALQIGAMMTEATSFYPPFAFPLAGTLAASSADHEMSSFDLNESQN